MQIETSNYFNVLPTITFDREFSREEIGKQKAITVNVWELYTQQKHIDSTHIKATKNKDIPLAVRVNDIIVIIDGHHRIAKKINEGQRSIKIRVLIL